MASGGNYWSSGEDEEEEEEDDWTLVTGLLVAMISWTLHMRRQSGLRYVHFGRRKQAMGGRPRTTKGAYGQEDPGTFPEKLCSFSVQELSNIWDTVISLQDQFPRKRPTGARLP